MLCVDDHPLVRKGIASLIQETRADEVIIVSDVYEHSERLRSVELIAKAGELAQAA